VNTFSGSLTFSDDYPWLRHVSPAGEVIDVDDATLLAGDPASEPVSNEPRVLDQSGSERVVRILDEAVEPPKLRLDAADTSVRGLPLTATYGSAYYLVGEINGVLVADPQRWTSDAYAAGLVGWFLFGETPADALCMRDHSAFNGGNQAIGNHVRETDRTYDSVRGWSLAVRSGDEPALVHTQARGLAATSTTTFWVKPSVAVRTDFLVHGPLACSLIVSGPDVQLSVDAGGVAVTRTLVADTWNMCAVVVTATGVTLFTGTSSVALASTHVAGSPRSYRSALKADSGSSTADGSSRQTVALPIGAVTNTVWVTVDGEAWMAVPSLLGTGASAAVFQVTAVNGRHTVIFGNGFDGHIPATGAVIRTFWETNDLTLTLRSSGDAFSIADLRVYDVAKTSTELESLRAPALVQAPVQWSTRYLESPSRKGQYALETLPCGLVFATRDAARSTANTSRDRERSYAIVQRYDATGAYIGDDARELTGIGGGAEPVNVFTLGSRVLGFGSDNVIVYSGTYGYPVGSITAAPLTNPIAQRIYLHEGSLTYVAKLSYQSGSALLTASPVQQAHTGDVFDLPNVPTDATYTYQGEWSASSYANRDVVHYGSTYWCATGAALSGNVPPASPWVPAHSLYDTGYPESLTDAVTVYGSNTRSLGVRYGSEVYARDVSTGTQAPVYLYLNATTALAVTDPAAYLSGGGNPVDERVELSEAGELEFAHDTALAAGRYRLFLDIGNNGLLDRGFDGFDLEILVGTSDNPTVLETRVFDGHAGERDPRAEVYVDVNLPALSSGWTLNLRWTNAIRNDDNWQRVLQLWGYRFELQQPDVYRLDIPGPGASVALSKVTLSSGSITQPGGWIGYVNSYGTIAAGSWVHESRAYGDSTVPASRGLHATTPARREDIYMAAWYEADSVSGPVAAPTVTVYGSRERETVTGSVVAASGTLRYAWDLTAWGGGWLDGQVVTSVPQGYGTKTYTVHAIDPNGYFASSTGTLFVHEAPRLSFVRTSADDEVIPYEYTGTAYGTCTTGTRIDYSYYVDGSLVHSGGQTSPFGAYKAPLQCVSSGAHVLKVVARQTPQDTFDEVYLNIHGRSSLAPIVSPIRSEPETMYAESTTPYRFSVVAYDEDGSESDLVFAWSVTSESQTLEFVQYEESWGNDRVQSVIEVPVTTTVVGEDYVVQVAVTDIQGAQTVRYLRLTVAENTPPTLVEDADGQPVSVAPGTIVPTNTTVVFSAARATDVDQQYPIQYDWNLWLRQMPVLPIAHAATEFSDSELKLFTPAGTLVKRKNSTAGITSVTGMQSAAAPAKGATLFANVVGFGYGNAVQRDGGQYRKIMVFLQNTEDGVPVWMFTTPTQRGLSTGAVMRAAVLTTEEEALVNANILAGPAIYPVMREVRALALTTVAGSLASGPRIGDNGVARNIRYSEDAKVRWQDQFPLSLKGTDSFGGLYLTEFPETLAKDGTSVVFRVTVDKQTEVAPVEHAANTRTLALYAAAAEGSSATITGSLTLTDANGGQSSYSVPEVTLLDRCLPPYVDPPGGVNGNGIGGIGEPIKVRLWPRTPGAEIRYTTGDEPLPPEAVVSFVNGQLTTRLTGRIYTRESSSPQVSHIQVMDSAEEGVSDIYGMAFVLYAGADPYYFYFSNQTERGDSAEPDPEVVPENATVVEIPIHRTDMSPVETPVITCDFTANSKDVRVTSGIENVRAGWEVTDARSTPNPVVLTGGELVGEDGVHRSPEITVIRVGDNKVVGRSHYLHGRFFRIYTTTVAEGLANNTECFYGVWFGTAAETKPPVGAVSFVHGGQRVRGIAVKITVTATTTANYSAAAIAAAFSGISAFTVTTDDATTVRFTMASIQPASDCFFAMPKPVAESLARYKWAMEITAQGESLFSMTSVAYATATGVAVKLRGGLLSKATVAGMIADALNSVSEFNASLERETVVITSKTGGDVDFTAAPNLQYERILEAQAEQVTEVSVSPGQKVMALCHKQGMFPSHVTTAAYEGV